MLLVIDTNILVNAIKSSDPNSKAAMLMRDVFNGVHKMCVSPDILDEYEDVLYRTELNLDRALVSYVLSWIKINAFLIDPKPTTQHEVQMVDEDDRIFFDVARCLNVRLVIHTILSARDGEPSFALNGCKIVLKATRSYGIL